MTIDLYINEANDYARDIGAPVLHPHVSVIHYDEVGEIRHTLNRTGCYGIFMQEEFPEGLTYGIGTYHDGDGSLIAFSPGQIGGKRDDGTRRQYHGWVLTDYYAHGMQKKNGLPSVKHCASELCLSPGYFGDVIRNALGESPKDYIRKFIVRRAKNLILSGRTIDQVAGELGFEYPQHFTSMFKNATGQTPRQFSDCQRKNSNPHFG